jgi:hypothetical protein
MLRDLLIWCVCYKILDEVILEAIFNWTRQRVAKSAFVQNQTAKLAKKTYSRGAWQPKKVSLSALGSDKAPASKNS